jgi:predicted RNase H-like HicB family nuclease
MSEDFNRKVYHKWDKKIFLNACGIEWEEPTKEINCNYIRVRICEDNSLLGYYDDDKEVCSMGNTFDELLVNLQHAKKAMEEAREKLAKEHPKVLSEDGNELFFDEQGNMIKKVESEEPDEETKQKLERFEKVLENGIANTKLNETCIDYGKIEHNPLDDLPIISDGVLMEVSDDSVNWVIKDVCAKYKNSFVAWTDHEHTISIQLWKQARPITPKTKITRKEFEQKFEIID